MHRQHIGDVELGTQAEKQGRHARAVGVRELREIAGPHHHLGQRQARPELAKSCQGLGETEMDGIENRIENGRDPAPLGLRRRAAQRVEIAVACGDENRARAGVLGDREGVFRQAEQEIRACRAAPAQFVDVRGIQTDGKAAVLQRPHGVLEMRERRIRQTTEIDHVGARGAETLRLRDNRLDCHS